MPKCSCEKMEENRQNILDGAAMLLEEKMFKDLSIKDISCMCQLSRPSIYNYFTTKEEIFLDLLSHENERWDCFLRHAFDRVQTLSRSEFAAILADSLQERILMLKLFANNLHEIESNSRIEKLVAFKSRFKATIEQVRHGLDLIEPDLSADQKELFVTTFFPFINGLYPYCFPSALQKEGMEKAGLDYPVLDVKSLVKRLVMQLLK